MLSVRASWPFCFDLACRLIATKAFERRLPDHPVSGPACELDLGHEDGLFFETLVAGTTLGPEAQERIKAFFEKRAEPLAVPGKKQAE